MHPPWTNDISLLLSPEWLRVFSWNFGNISKIFIQNIFSALSLKYKVSARNQIAISQCTHNLLTKFHMEKTGSFLLFKFLTWLNWVTSRFSWEASKIKPFKTNRWIIKVTDYRTLPAKVIWVCNHFGQKLQFFVIHRNKSDFSNFRT